ncbi:MAG TPA: 50S ribosomal protein P1 [Nitrososphaeraceae archaeon]|jgi:large subunit ribosomal protein L12|nr:50S ribosomal protein P1 [Nitrososphaeraceae archaeon]HZL23686.1 50S ribosomal protein P1 [Nitrososphaeraceae archaeon]
MEYVYAALLLHKLKQDINEDNVTNVIKATGSAPDAVKIKALVAALGDVDIEAALKAAPMTMAPAAGVTSASGAAAPEAAVKETAEDEKTEKKEEEALEGLSSLFG